LSIEGGGLGFVDAFLGVTGMGSDDGGNGGDDAGVFHGRLGLNARHVTLVAVGAGCVQHPVRDERVLILALFAADRPSEGHKRPPLSRVRAVQNPELLRLAVWGLPGGRRFEPRDRSDSLKNPLQRAQYFPGKKCCSTATTRVKWHRIFTRRRPLARLLHCIVKSLACPINLCADGDSRTEAVTLRHWNPSAASGIYR
jgi:hypothetical protein